MTSAYRHHILVVDSDEQTAKILDPVLKAENQMVSYTRSSESALARIQSASTPFSLIITAQNPEGVDGTRFLEQAKALTPESIRILMADISQMDTIINAVNKGAIQRYITKPLKADEADQTIRSGIRLYELFLESEKLTNLAKKQNTSLYELNCELMERAKSHNKTIHALAAEIEQLENRLKAAPPEDTAQRSDLAEKISAYVGLKNENKEDRLRQVFWVTLEQLFLEFDALGRQSGFEMPADIKGNLS